MVLDNLKLLSHIENIYNRSNTLALYKQIIQDNI